MKAVVIQEHGGPDKLRIEEFPEPEYSEDEVVIKVHSAGLNHLDIWVRKGRGGLNLPKPHIPGSDAAGVVVAAGSKVTNVTVGDEVIVNPGLSCGCCEYCNRGEQSECISFGIMGLTRRGTFAEQVAVPSRNVWPKPSHMNFNEAGAFVLSHLTACTPDFFLFDSDKTLVYRGQMDDSRPGNGIPVTGADLTAAIDAVLKGKQVSEEQKPSIGCNIKWKQENMPD